MSRVYSAKCNFIRSCIFCVAHNFANQRLNWAKFHSPRHAHISAHSHNLVKNVRPCHFNKAAILTKLYL
uniref:Secreted protein n=1 Tax=Macrostomum lignano TaxID=282301 RepID=A0A1I8F3V1_9PLAT